MKRQKIVSKVIEIKEFAKEQIESEVKKSREALDREKERLSSLEAMFRKTAEEFSDKQDAGMIKVHELELYSNYLLQLSRQIEKQKEAVSRHRVEYEGKQKALVEAYKEQRLFEILHDKMLHEDVREALIREQKESDERFLTRRIGR